MNKEIILNIHILHLNIKLECKLSLDLSLNDNIILLNELINKYINTDYIKGYNPLIVLSNTGQILKKDIPLNDINLIEGSTLLFY